MFWMDILWSIKICCSIFYPTKQAEKFKSREIKKLKGEKSSIEGGDEGSDEGIDEGGDEGSDQADDQGVDEGGCVGWLW